MGVIISAHRQPQAAHMTNPLGELLDQLAALDYNHLRDLLDRLDLHEQRPGAAERRKGIEGGATANRILRSIEARAAWEALSVLEPTDRLNARKVIALLYNALEPKPERKRRADDTAVARGIVTIKSIPRTRVISVDPLEFETVHYRYVYIRYSATAGGLDKRGKKFMNFYVRESRQLASVLDQLEDTNPAARAALVEQILDAWHDGTLDQLVRQYSGGEAEQTPDGEE